MELEEGELIDVPASPQSEAYALLCSLAALGVPPEHLVDLGVDPAFLLPALKHLHLPLPSPPPPPPPQLFTARPAPVAPARAPPVARPRAIDLIEVFHPPTGPSQLVIDLSDSEDDDYDHGNDSEDESELDSDSEVASALLGPKALLSRASSLSNLPNRSIVALRKHTFTTHSASPTPPLSLSNQPTSTAAPPTQVSSLLAQKQDEIQKLQARIKAMEEKKKTASTPTTAPTSPVRGPPLELTTAPIASTSTPRPSPPPTTTPFLSRRSNPPPPPPPPETLLSSPPRTQMPYHSPSQILRLPRSTPFPFPPPLSSTAALATYTAVQRKLDPGVKLCKSELAGGICADEKCASNHVRDFQPTDTEIAAYLLELFFPAPKPALEAVYKRGLELAFAPLARPLVWAEAFARARRFARPDTVEAVGVL